MGTILVDKVLATWESLNKVVRDANEDVCRVLLKTELEGRRRTQFALRIYSRMNRMRAVRERRDLLAAAKHQAKVPPWL